MRKILLGLVAAAAIATPLAIATAANAATTDVNGVVTVSKGEIMAEFPDMNEKTFQKIAMADGESLTGSNVFTATTTTGVGCSDGTVQNHFRSTHHHQPDRAHRDLQRLGRQGHRLDPRRQGRKRHHRDQHLRHRFVEPLPELRHHLRRTRLSDEPVRDLRAEPQRRDVVHDHRTEPG